MADIAEMAPTKANSSRRASAANGAARSRRTARAQSDDLESQVAQLQSDLRSITNTLTRMGETQVDNVKSTAKAQARSLVDRGQSALDDAQDEFGAIEKQIKDTIREKPLTAVAGAIALGFVLAVVTR